MICWFKMNGWWSVLHSSSDDLVYCAFMKYFLKYMSVTKRSLLWDIPDFSQQGWVSDPLHCPSSFKETVLAKKGLTTNWRKSFTVDPYCCVLKGWIQFCANISPLTHNGFPRNCSHDEPLMKTLNLKSRGKIMLHSSSIQKMNISYVWFLYVNFSKAI